MSSEASKEENSVDMDVVVAKILSLVIITIITVLCGLVPCRLVRHFNGSMIKRRHTFDYILCGAKCFSGGVFLGVCFLHLIPETRYKVDAVLDQLGSRSKYPVAELLTIAGFFGVIFGEHVIRYLYYRCNDESCFPAYDHDSYSFDDEYLPSSDDPILTCCNDIECKSLRSLSHENSLENIQMHTRIENVFKDECTVKINNITTDPNLKFNTNINSDTNSNSANTNPHLTNANVHISQIQDRLDMEIEPAPLPDLEVKTVVTELSRGEEGNRIRSVLLITALSFHGVFEGMALSLQTLEGDVWIMCIAISIHRGILSFGMGLQYARDYEKPATTVFIISAFSIICAVGVIIGIVISAGAQLYSDVDVPNAILQSLSTGTIFYIIFLNILFKELDGNKDVKKISCTFIGFAFMAIVFAIAKQE